MRQAVETAKRILRKEKKINRQLAGELSSTPFMSIKDGYISKKVTFNLQDSLDDKIDRHTSMMSKLTAQDNNQNKLFKPKIYQSKWRGQSRNFYDQIIIIREIIKIDIGHIAEIEECQTEVKVSMDIIMEEDCISILEIHKITDIKILEVDTEGIIEMIILEGVGVALGTNNIKIISEGIIEVVVGLDQVQELVLIEIELDAINIGNMIFCWLLSNFTGRKRGIANTTNP